MSINMQRINEGKPVITAPYIWELRGTSNNCALFLERNEENDRIIASILGEEILSDKRIEDGIVVSLYTGVGKFGSEMRRRQHRGLYFFTPELETLKRLDEPVLSPSDNKTDIDSRGVEDARLIKIGDTFYAWYCGYNGKDGAACAAYSKDLIHWTKSAPLPGNINNTYNKDHVVFPERIFGKWWMLHRPWGPKFPNINDMVIRLAVSDDLLGPWEDAGEIIRAYTDPNKESTWVGAGPCPISLGNNRYLLIYHRGCYFPNRYREYDACAALLDFNLYSEDKPEDIVVKRLEPIMVPETSWETNLDWGIEIVFPMGTYIYKGDLMMVYGAGDRCTCAAKVLFDELMEELEKKG